MKNLKYIYIHNFLKILKEVHNQKGTTFYRNVSVKKERHPKTKQMPHNKKKSKTYMSAVLPNLERKAAVIIYDTVT